MPRRDQVMKESNFDENDNGDYGFSRSRDCDA